MGSPRRKRERDDGAPMRGGRAVADRIGVRDGKNPRGGHLALTPTAFSVLLHHVKTGDLDL